jgi:DNA mismatch endonuclease (patch repair protein)
MDEKRRGKSKKSPSYAGLKPASEAASHAKRSNRKKDTRHEVLLRQALWRIGLRYRKYLASLPGNPDVVFSRAKVVVFCDGDFWHGRHWKSLKAKLQQGTNAPYWLAKIARNRQRDTENNARLKRSGWYVVRLWETDIIANPDAAAEAIGRIVSSRLSEETTRRRA